MEILRQLGQLFLQAIPTVILVFLFYLFMKWAFFAPIRRAMEERHARIEGARAEAAAVEEVAKNEMDAYHEALRKARAEIFDGQEKQRQAVLEERSRLLKAMRARAREEAEEAKKKLQAELATARAQVERDTPALAAEIARVILENPSALGGGVTR
jgi:F0F1-type ATP synthase membrane subunit b/b'